MTGRLSAPPFVLTLGAMPDGPGRFAARELARGIAQLVAEFLHVEVFGDGGQPVPVDLPATGWRCMSKGSRSRGGIT